jgi:outer membrane receptor protein involved in Fe transport
MKHSVFVLFLSALLVSPLAVLAQTGKITGKVIDKKTGEELIGVTVVIEGTSFGAATDYEGKFLISNVKPGNYNLNASYVSYNKKVITNVVVKSNEVTTVNFALEESNKELKEVVISGELKKETVSALLIQQRNAVSIGNGVSAEMIKQTPDNNTGEVMKRISGTTIQNGKFAVIRGLNDRYNAAMINGSPLPSTEPERKAFSFDLIPSNMVDQIVIIKTATPDLPGDFAGGVIQLTTKETPERGFFNFQISGGYNNLATFKDFKSYQGSPTDFLGYDNGTRTLPPNFPSTSQIRTGSGLDVIKNEIEAGKMLNNNYTIQTNNALPNYGMQISGGKTYDMGRDKIGVLFSANYSNSRSFQQVNRTWADNTKIQQFNYIDSLYEQNYRLGALLNITYKIRNNHKISFKNTLNLNAEDAVVTRVGPAQAEGIYKRAYSYMFTQNSMLLNQLFGEHYLPGAKIKLNWELSRGETGRKLPDYKNVEYRGNQPNDLTLAVINRANDNAARLFTDLREVLTSASGAVTVPMNRIRSSVKMGAFYQYKDRTFDARMLGFAISRNTTFDQSLRLLPVGEIFRPENMSLNGFRLNDITNPSHQYTANASTKAAFIMIENRISARWKLIWGGRFESYNQRLISATRNDEPVDVNTTFNDFLPSLNVTYSVNENSNIRFAASKTVSRPELRELAPFSFYDFSTFSSLEGNSNLQRATITNIDLRYELYPSATQVVSFALFNKNFTNPIELVLANDMTLGVTRRSFVNLPTARALGAEFDYRVNITDALTTYGNFSYIFSRIEAGNNDNRWNASRPMQGQSPYIANIGFLYKFDKPGIAVSALYNIYGDRVYNVGNTSFPDIYEKNRHVIDLQISKLFFDKRFETKISVNDVLAQDLIYFMDFTRTNDYVAGEDEVVFRYKMPRIINFSLSYRIQ